MDVAGERSGSSRRREGGARNPAATTRRKTPLPAAFAFGVVCLQGRMRTCLNTFYFPIKLFTLLLLLLVLLLRARSCRYSRLIKTQTLHPPTPLTSSSGIDLHDLAPQDCFTLLCLNSVHPARRDTLTAAGGAGGGRCSRSSIHSAERFRSLNSLFCCFVFLAEGGGKGVSSSSSK